MEDIQQGRERKRPHKHCAVKLCMLSGILFLVGTSQLRVGFGTRFSSVIYVTSTWSCPQALRIVGDCPDQEECFSKEERIMKHSRLSFILKALLLLALLVLVPACGGTSPQTSAPKEILIGASLPETGALAGFGPY